MNDTLPESERWVPVKFDPSLSGPFTVQGGDKLGPEFYAESAKNGPPEQFAKSAYCSPALDRARREAEAVIADRFNRIS